MEVADHVVWIDDLLFLYQLKERGSTGGDIEKWVKKKIVKEATKQIRDTIGLSQSEEPVLIYNDYGHPFDFTQTRSAHTYKLVLFRVPGLQVPGPRYHISSTVGFIHIFNIIDYQDTITRLYTPVELADYLAFRETLLRKYRPNDLPSEGALLGQYLTDSSSAKPSEHFAAASILVLDDRSEYDLTTFFGMIRSRIEFQAAGPTSYYRMLAELCKLTRAELKHFKLRFRLTVDAAMANRLERPYRFVDPRTDCGFLFLPLTSEQIPKRKAGLENLSLAAKYDQRTSRQVGLSVAREGDDITIEWSFAEHPWVANPYLEERLRTAYPFRPLGSARAARYTFRTADLSKHGLS